MWIVLNSVLGIDGGVVDPRGGSALLSCHHDRDSMDAIRASADAVLVGAGTIRTEDPSLALTSPERQAERLAAGRAAHPLPVVLSSRGDLADDRRIFADGEPRPLLVVGDRRADVADQARQRAEIEVLDGELTAPAGAVRILERRGVKRLVVEGGPSVARSFVEAELFDEVCLTLSPRLGASPAPRASALRMVELDLADVRATDGFLYLRYVRRVPRDGG